MCPGLPQKITERFSRNPDKSADDDVQERSFLIPEERVQLRFHCLEDRITASKREYLRRLEVDSKGNKIIMTPEMCVCYEVSVPVPTGPRNPHPAHPSNLEEPDGNSACRPEIHLYPWGKSRAPVWIAISLQSPQKVNPVNGDVSLSQASQQESQQPSSPSQA